MIDRTIYVPVLIEIYGASRWNVNGGGMPFFTFNKFPCMYTVELSSELHASSILQFEKGMGVSRVGWSGERRRLYMSEVWWQNLHPDHARSFPSLLYYLPDSVLHPGHARSFPSLLYYLPDSVLHPGHARSFPSLLYYLPDSVLHPGHARSFPSLLYYLPDSVLHPGHARSFPSLLYYLPDSVFHDDVADTGVLTIGI